MSDQQIKEIHTKEIEFSELIFSLWTAKYSILSFCSLIAILSVFYSLWLPNVYESRALLAPRAEAGPGGALSNLASQFGGLASFAGVDLNSISSQGLPKGLIAQEKMQSLGFFELYLYEDILVDLMAASHWNQVDRKLIYDKEIYDEFSGNWLRDVEPPFLKKPSAQEAHEAFLEAVSIEEDKQTGLVTLSVRHISPDAAQFWAELLISSVSKDLRDKEINEAERSIEFLEKQREKTSLVSLEEIFAQLIEEQTKIIMLANSSEDYVFDVIDKPALPEFKIGPKRALICILSTFLALVFATCFYLIRFVILYKPKLVD